MSVLPAASCSTKTATSERSTSSFDVSSVSDSDVFIIAAKRTPLGAFGGSLSSLSASQLGSIVIKGAMESAGIINSDGERSGIIVDEVIMGNVLQANNGQNIARQCALLSGLPVSTVCSTVNKVCASGMKAVSIAAQSIRCGDCDVIIAGGTECMSQCPYYLTGHRFGVKMGDKTMVDGMIKDGLWDAMNDLHMGSCAEVCAFEYSIGREEQDSFAVQSYQRGIHATDNGVLKNEIIPVTLKNKKTGKETIIDRDEGLAKFNESKLRKLRTVFPLPSVTKHLSSLSQPIRGAMVADDSTLVTSWTESASESNDSDSSKSLDYSCMVPTVTAGNASPLSDGASALVIVSGKALKQYSDTLSAPLAKIVSYADTATVPIRFTVAPSLAIPKALRKIGMDLSDLDMEKDLFEINEAFAVAGIANCRLLGIPQSRCNILGGSVSMGHPLGCSGARILTTLISSLKSKPGSRFGVAGICNGGGGGSAMILENIEISFS